MTTSSRPWAPHPSRDGRDGKGRSPRLSRDVGEARLLIADGDERARAPAAQALRTAGFVVYEASTGLDALKVFQARRPHIVLLEVMTPFVDGFSTCRAMRDLPGGDAVSIVMMTDLDDLESLQFGFDAGATDFLTKPLNPTLLQHRMKYMLRAGEVADELRRSERKIAHLAYHDALTGLPNRRSLEHYVQRLVGALCHGVRPGAVFLIDLDGFKRINDTFGHGAGDEAIVELARRLEAGFTSAPTASDVDLDGRPMLARLAGDEFVFVAPTITSAEEASELASRMLTAIGGVLDVRGLELVITASIGIVLLSDGSHSVETILQSADAAMYDAKAHDRNNARFYAPVLSEKARTQLDIESELRHALSREEFALFYQPKVDASTGLVAGAEALIRWRHPEQGIISPAQFIPVAEETGLIVPIGTWVLREACRQARAWNEDPQLKGLRIAVNVAARQFRDSRFVDLVKETLAQSGLDANALELEVTEGTLMDDTKAARAVLGELKAMGVWLALDDFGTGYSSLGYLRRFPFDTLKVDRSFITDMLVDADCAAITGAVIAMAKQLRLTVVAEGVETAEQFEYLKALGCTQIQGYFHSRPVPAEDFARWAAGRVAATPHGSPRTIPVGRHSSVIPPLRKVSD